MKLQKVKNIRLFVRDEQELYAPFSPDGELNESVKSYIRSKALSDDLKQRIELTVISASPLDEEKFRSAVANWIKEERAAFDQSEKRSIHLPRIMFFVGTSIIVLVSLLKHYFEPLTYAIVLIIGTAVAGKGVTNWYEKVPVIKVQKWLTTEIEKASTIVFEYEDGQGASNSSDDA